MPPAGPLRAVAAASLPLRDVDRGSDPTSRGPSWGDPGGDPTAAVPLARCDITRPLAHPANEALRAAAATSDLFVFSFVVHEVAAALCGRASDNSELDSELDSGGGSDAECLVEDSGHDGTTPSTRSVPDGGGEKR
eukprot:1904268-Pyramimonas_sp.AAC.1